MIMMNYRKVIILAIALLLILVGSVSAIINPSFSYFKPFGYWAEDRYSGGMATMFSLEFVLVGHVALVPIEVGYCDLGKDETLIRYIQAFVPPEVLQGYDVSDVRSNMWILGGGVKVNLLPKKLATPYIMGGYYFFLRGVKLAGIPMPFIPGYTDQSRINYNHGFGIDVGVTLLPGKLLSATMGLRYFYAKGAGTNEIDTEVLGMPPMDAQFFLFHAGVDFL